YINTLYHLHFFFNHTSTTEIYTLSLHDALPISSICGTDVHIYNWDSWAQNTIPVPMTIGHEFVGVVDRVGNLVKGFAKGDLVVGDRKSTRLNSSHLVISYAVFCLKKKNNSKCSI